jgi:hypothetical protein
MAPPEQWRVEQVKFDQLNRWRLYIVRNERWVAISYYPSVEEAMQAVAAGRTGVATWDAVSHDPDEFAKEKWSEAD